ncbi:fructose PTS transporter subunit IIA [Aquibacillus sp. 3ASR75-11]|uniref:Fructose PTS transporter subunit IIA n=1 Tax=Terrihalobacillus insolitus TaxID=2950438 RepID=A0A9X4AMB6_9BACI|nr:fructose PTS transporter subunit IIA [Terrihalobacillus insolitus]MDC3411990.1 fructose PTS transporter subunit IIA [Terrihalobacillus insolitus]MDC3423325.1 fructose PTS transporter subunit IIA [Terrihalobacillus insolitus]
MALTDLLKTEHVLLDIEAVSKEACIDQLTSAMEQTGVVHDADAYKRAVLKREEEGTTGIGFGVAIPHGKSSGVSQPGLAFARVTSDVDWESLDGTPVRHVFLIAVPEEQAGNEHLQILSQLSRKLMHEDFREKLQSATTIEELIGALE